MTIRKRTGVVALGLATVLLAGRLPLVAQEPDSRRSAEAPAKKRDPAHRVPPYFGQIGLTLEQRASIYNIQAKRIEKIEAMEKQIKVDRAAMLSDCEAVLNETQRKLLDNLRKAAADPASKPVASSKVTEAPKP